MGSVLEIRWGRASNLHSSVCCWPSARAGPAPWRAAQLLQAVKQPPGLTLDAVVGAAARCVWAEPCLWGSAERRALETLAALWGW